MKPSKINNAQTLKFSNFTIQKTINYSLTKLEKKKKKKLRTKVAFGCSLERAKQERLYTLPDYDINYESIDPSSKKAIIYQDCRSRRAVTEVSHTILPKIDRHSKLNEIIISKSKPLKFALIQEYTPKVYEKLPYNNEELNEMFKQLLYKHKVRKAKMYQ